MILKPIVKQHNFDTDLFREWTCIHGLAFDFQIDEPQSVVLSGHMDVHHRGLVNGAVGYAGALSIVKSPSTPLSSLFWNTPIGTKIDGSVNGGNILSEADHYGKVIWSGCVHLNAGSYRIMAHAVSHSDLAPSTDGLAEVLIEGGKGLNCLIATFHG